MAQGNRKGYIYPNHKVLYPLFPKHGESYIPILGSIPGGLEDGEIVSFKKTPSLGPYGQAIKIGKIRKQRNLAKEYATRSRK